MRRNFSLSTAWIGASISSRRGILYFTDPFLISAKDNANETIEYYKEIEKTKEELYVEELQDVKEQLNAAQEAIDFLIEMGGDVWWQDIWLWELKVDIWIIV